MNEPSDKPSRSLWDILRRIGWRNRSFTVAEPDPIPDGGDSGSDQPIASPRSLWEVMGDGPGASRSAEQSDGSERTPVPAKRPASVETTDAESSGDGLRGSSTVSPKPIFAPPAAAVPSVCSRRAMLSLTLGMLSLPASALGGFDNVVWNLPALVLGFGAVLAGLASLGEIRRSDGAQTGRGVALAGILLGAIGMFLGPIVFADVRQRPAGNSDWKIGSGFDFATVVLDNRGRILSGPVRHADRTEMMAGN